MMYAYYPPDRYHLKQLADRSAKLREISHKLRSESKKICAEAAAIRLDTHNIPKLRSPLAEQALIVVSEAIMLRQRDRATVKLNVQVNKDTEPWKLILDPDSFQSS